MPQHQRSSDAVSTLATAEAGLPPTLEAIRGAAALASVQAQAPIVPAPPAGTTTKTLGSDHQNEDDDDNRPPPSVWPPRFGDGNTEPGSHLHCCYSRIRISYCKLSQVVLASLVASFIVATLASTVF